MYDGCDDDSGGNSINTNDDLNNNFLIRERQSSDLKSFSR